jgi:hypothetical protein
MLMSCCPINFYGRTERMSYQLIFSSDLLLRTAGSLTSATIMAGDDGNHCPSVSEPQFYVRGFIIHFRVYNLIYHQVLEFINKFLGNTLSSVLQVTLDSE